MQYLFSKIIVILLAFICCIELNAQKKEQIIIGESDTIYSKILGEQRRILIHTPTDEPDGFAIKQHYPVLFVLDGEFSFQSVVAITEGLGGGTMRNWLRKQVMHLKKIIIEGNRFFIWVQFKFSRVNAFV